MTNLLPDLEPWDYELLKASIARDKLLVPILKDEFGNTIDGHQRERACRELGITDYRIEIIAGLTDEEKRDRAFTLNLVRRRLNQQQMKHLIASELRRMPDLSDNWLAQILGTTDKTVATVRRELIATSEIPKLDALRGKDGKFRRVTRIVTRTAKEAERAQRALEYLGDRVPKRDVELRLVERHVKRVQKLEKTYGNRVQPPGDGEIRLFHCPFQELEGIAEIQPTSVNLILTDIPYGHEFLPQVDELGAFASRILVDGGLLVTYSGSMFLNRVIRSLDEHLNWAWAAASAWMGDGTIVHPRQVTSKWKPILIYSKGEWRKRGRWQDLSILKDKEKDWHDWQQPLGEVEWLVRFFSEPDDLVVDPCGGGFTTALACRNLGRRCIACDVDEGCVIRGQNRLDQGSPGLAG